MLFSLAVPAFAQDIDDDDIFSGTPVSTGVPESRLQVVTRDPADPDKAVYSLWALTDFFQLPGRVNVSDATNPGNVTSVNSIVFGSNLSVAFAGTTATITGQAGGGGGGSTTFTGLTDTPSAYVNNRYLRSSSGALVFRTNGQVRADIGANNASNLNAGTVGDARIPAGIARDSELVTTFVGLTDTPAALVADMCLAVNAAGTAVVLQACATGGGGASSSVTSLTFEAVGGVLNLRQSIGGTVTATGFMTPTLVDARIDPAARIPPIGTFADAQIPTNVARVPQLPIVAAARAYRSRPAAGCRTPTP